MNITVEALRELHRLHRQQHDLKDRLSRGPKQVRAGQANVQRLEAALAIARDHNKRARMQADEKNLQLKQREAKIADLQRKLNECKTNAEFSALKDQIAAERQANSVLEDEILDKLEQIDRLQQEVAEVDKNLQLTRKELAATEKRIAEEQAGLESELHRIQELLREAETALPTEFKVEYTRIVRARGEDALAPVDGESCGGCYTILTPQTLNELYLSRPVFCKSCGCLLYLPEDRTIGR
jgi:predicted  nucleic acid-binding Zn-ribbon protein